MTDERKALKNRIRIEIAGANLVIEDADIEVEVKKTNEKAPNYCTVTIYNTSDTTYNTIKDKSLYVKVYADIRMQGYDLIFEGDLRGLRKYKKPSKSKPKSKYTKRGKLRKVRKSTATPSYNEPAVRTEDDGADVKTIIELQDRIKTQFLNFHYTVAYEGKISNIEILKNCLKTLQAGNIGQGQIDTPKEFIFSNGYSYSGPIYNLMTQMAALGSCNLTIQNGTISCITKGGKNLDWVYVLDGTTCPRPEEDTNKEINVDAPILPGLNPDNLVKLDFDKINGVYKVYKIDTSINNYGGSGQGSKIVVKDS